MTRYYLQQLPDTTWQITLQDDSSGDWEDQSVHGVYKTQEEAVSQSLSPLCWDTPPFVPEDLGGVL